MWRSTARLSLGAILLALGGYCFFTFAVKGNKTIQREVDTTEQTPADTKSRPKDDDDALEGAKLHAYGPLASVATEEPTAEEPATRPPARRNSGPLTELDRASTAPPDAARRLVHRRLHVKYAQCIGFVIPAQAPRPRLDGSFVASGGSGAIEVMLMNADEFDQFTHHHEVSVEFSQNASSRGQISWMIKATYRDPQKYYLVFHNPSEAANPISVDADFTLSFE